MLLLVYTGRQIVTKGGIKVQQHRFIINMSITRQQAQILHNALNLYKISTSYANDTDTEIETTILMEKITENIR